MEYSLYTIVVIAWPQTCLFLICIIYIGIADEEAEALRMTCVLKRPQQVRKLCSVSTNKPGDPGRSKVKQNLEQTRTLAKVFTPNQSEQRINQSNKECACKNRFWCWDFSASGYREDTVEWERFLLFFVFFNFDSVGWKHYPHFWTLPAIFTGTSLTQVMQCSAYTKTWRGLYNYPHVSHSESSQSGGYVEYLSLFTFNHWQ